MCDKPQSAAYDLSLLRIKILWKQVVKKEEKNTKASGENNIIYSRKTQMMKSRKSFLVFLKQPQGAAFC